VKVAPFPSPALSTEIVPPCARTMAFEIASPSPRPPNFRVIELCPCSKALKTLSIFSGSIPIPESVVRMAMRSSLGFELSTTMVPPAGVNFTAFLIRFQKTCWSLAGSPLTNICSALNRNSKRRFFFRMSA
jgi:hypothetical protein